jgi:SAM-dependent methyltransferase
MSDELNLVKERYSKRNLDYDNRYNPLNPSVYMKQVEVEVSLAKLLKKANIYDLSDKFILEIGAGSGNNLLQFIRLGALPANLWGNELLEKRLNVMRRNLPNAVHIKPGDASTIDLPNESFDIVYQSTVFSSILDVDFQQKLADKMWALIKSKGGILWYDFIYNNPKNPDVKGVSLKRIKTLFPNGKLLYMRVTLAPPISRIVTKIHPSLYTVFNAFPFLRTHVLCWIGKE